jgi:hypothetical protein
MENNALRKVKKALEKKGFTLKDFFGEWTMEIWMIWSGVLFISFTICILLIAFWGR